MSNLSLKYQVLAELLRSLEAEGFVLGTGKHLQMQDLLSKLPEMEVEQLKGIFAPVICTNEKEQELFYTIFDQSLERAKAVHQPIEESNRKGDVSNKWKKWIWLLAIPVVLATAFLLRQFFWQEVVEVSPTELPLVSFTVNTDSTKVVCLEDRLGEELQERFSVFVQSGLDEAGLVQKGSTEKGVFEIENKTCLRYTAKDIPGADSIRLFLVDSVAHKTSVVFYPHIEKLEVADAQPVAQQARFETKPYPYPNDIRSLEVEPLSTMGRFYANNHWWLKPLFILLLAGLLWAIIKYRDAKRQKLVAEIESKNKAPYVWNIKIEDAANIEMNDAFYSVLNKLRQRTVDEATRLDVPKTIEATIGKGGMASFKYRQLTRPPEYLLLIDQQSGANHRAKVFDYLYKAFHANEIIIERFFFDGDPRLCYNEAYPKGLNIKELYHRYYNSRLLMMSNGYSLLSPLSGKLSKWASLFDQWKQRSILTPIANAAWGKRESRLDESFDILPATLEGLNFLVEQLDAGEDGDFSNWKEKIKDAPKETIQLKGGLLTSLRHYYSEDMLEWIAACAVYPSMHWDLTVHIGELLSTTDKNLLTINNLLEMVRLPWFSAGEIPEAARARLLDYLEESHPDTLQKVRVGLHELLQKNKPPTDSIAFEDHQMNVALNEWLLTDDKKRKKELEQEIAQQLEAGVEADFTVIKYLDREKTPLDFIVPNAWKKYVHKGGHAGLGMKDVWKDVFYWALPILFLLGGLMLWYHPQDVCEGELVTYERLGEEFLLCIDSPADRMLLHEYQAREAIGVKFYGVVDSLVRATNSLAGIENVKELVPGLGELNLIKTVDFTSEDSLAYRSFFKNTAVEYYNRAVPVVEGIEENKGRENYDESFFRNIACELFTRAAILDNKDNDIRVGKAEICKGIAPSGLVTASFSVSKSECCAPCKLNFTNTSTNADRYEWDFDDNSLTVPVRTFETQDHVFFRPGTYTVKLTASNEEGSDVSTVEVVVKECDDEDPETSPNDNVVKYEALLEEVYATALSDIESIGMGVCKRDAENSIEQLNSSKSKISFGDNEESNQATLGSFRDEANYLVSLVEKCNRGVDITNESTTEQKEIKAEEIYKNTLATLEKFLSGPCSKLAKGSIKTLKNNKKEVVFYGMQTSIANPEQKNQQILDNFRKQSEGLVTNLRQCENSAEADFELEQQDPDPKPESIPVPIFDLQKLQNVEKLKKEFQKLGNTASKCLNDPHLLSLLENRNSELVGTNGVTENPKRFIAEFEKLIEDTESFAQRNVIGDGGVVKDIKNKGSIDKNRYKELTAQIKRYDKRLKNYLVLSKSIKIKEEPISGDDNLLTAFEKLAENAQESLDDPRYKSVRDLKKAEFEKTYQAGKGIEQLVSEYNDLMKRVERFISSNARVKQKGGKTLVLGLIEPENISIDKYNELMNEIADFNKSLNRYQLLMKKVNLEKKY